LPPLSTPKQEPPNPHPELPNLVPISTLENDANTKLYQDVERTRQMLKRWGWLKPQIYDRVKDYKTYEIISNAKRSGNIVDILEAMPIADFGWDFLKVVLTHRCIRFPMMVVRLQPPLHSI